MKRSIVRLRSLELKNIKNVTYGKIEMPNCYKKHLLATDAEVLGVYGQNGSGKTALIDALYFLQKIMLGESIEDNLYEYISNKSGEAEINAEFCIQNPESYFEVAYNLELKKTEEKKVVIEKEKIYSAKTLGDVRTNKVRILEYNCDNKNIFSPKIKFEEAIANNKDNELNLIVAKKMSQKNNCSFIFGESSREVFLQDYENSFKDCSYIIKSLYKFALADLFVIRNTHSGVISANFILPMAFRINGGEIGLKGDFAVPLDEPVVLNAERADVLCTIINDINIVLHTIIPGLVLDIRRYGSQLLDNGEQGEKMELLSVRGDAVIPIRMESAGIIKIISILNALVQAFSDSSICLVVDELDAGIFEYLLGELLDIFNRKAKGQLLFTSHNLRALEMLESKSIMFSTTNPNNRYIHMKNIKQTNNLRDVFLRSITLGGQDEFIYEETDSLKMERAFRKAGRVRENEKP